MSKLLDLFMYLLAIGLIATASIMLMNASKENNPHISYIVGINNE